MLYSCQVFTHLHLKMFFITFKTFIDTLYMHISITHLTSWFSVNSFNIKKYYTKKEKQNFLNSRYFLKLEYKNGKVYIALY